MQVTGPTSVPDAREDAPIPRAGRNPFEVVLWVGACGLLLLSLLGAYLSAATLTSGRSYGCSESGCDVPVAVVLGQLSYLVTPATLTGSVLCAVAAVTLRAFRHDRSRSAAAGAQQTPMGQSAAAQVQPLPAPTAPTQQARPDQGWAVTSDAGPVRSAPPVPNPDHAPFMRPVAER